MNQEFINRRIKEQVAYIFDISNSVSIDSKRQVELIKSAEGQLEYFKNQLFNIEKQKMNKSLKQVAEFHQLFEHPIGMVTELEPLKTRQLRVKLLFEELAELAEAGDVKKTMADLCNSYLASLNVDARLEDGNNVDKVEELDALCDIQYVLNGKVLTAGLHPIFEAAFDLVHSNNMTKAHVSREHALATIIKNNLMESECSITEKGEGIWMLYNKDAKLTKPHDHVKVSLSPLVENWLKGVKIKYEGKDTVEIVRDEIVNLLRESNCFLSISSGKNQSFEKYANREAFDDQKVTAIFVAPNKKAISKGEILPVQVFAYDLLS